MQYDHSLTRRRDVQRSRDAVTARHAHLPQLALDMLYMRLAYAGQTELHDAFGNPQESRLHIRRQRGDFGGHAVVEHFNSPCHLGESIAFMLYRQVGPDNSWRLQIDV